MGEQSQRFRERARDCLNLAKGARTQTDRSMLEDLAADLVAEAKVLEAQERDGLPAGSLKATPAEGP